jgi:epoxide hydrolase 4
MTNYTHTTISTNGVNLHVVQVGPQDGKLVILLHGFPEFWYGWRKQIDFLAAQGYWVWVPDQRGYNLSDKPQGLDAYVSSNMAADVIGLIDAAGREKAAVIGHDWGAVIAWTVAFLYPERVEKLGIINVPHPVAFTDYLRENPTQLLKSWYVFFFQLPVLPEIVFLAADSLIAMRALFTTSLPGTFNDEDAARYTRAWHQPGAMTGMINWYRASVQRPLPQADDTRVHIPTLILWGAQDSFLEAEMAKLSLGYCTQGHLIVFDENTHWVHHEAPEKINPLLGDFLEKGLSAFSA